MVMIAAVFLLMTQFLNHRTIHTAGAFHLDCCMGNVKPLSQQVFEGLEIF